MAVWIIFGSLLALLIGFLVFTFIKDKRKNRKLAQKRIELKRATIRSSKELAIKIYTLIEFNDQKIKEIKPGSSKIKMKHVNFTVKKYLKDIYDSRMFKTIYIDSDESDPNYSKNIKNLLETKSNLWNKYCQKEISYFQNFHNELLDDEKFNTIKEKANEEINNFFEEIVKQQK